MATKTIPIPEAKLRQAYNNAGNDVRSVLLFLCDADVFKSKPLMELMTFEDVCEAAGEDIADYELVDAMTYKEKADIGMNRLMLYEKVFNGDKPVDRADIKRKRYFPWHNTVVDSEALAGFRLSFGGCGYGYSDADLGARPEFNDNEHAIFVGTQHIGEYETWAQNFQMSKTNP